MRFMVIVKATPESEKPGHLPDPKLFQEMVWREIGPYRGGRSRALAGARMTSSASIPSSAFNLARN